MKQERLIRVGTRGSRLAIAQADMVIDTLHQKFPQWKIEKKILRTKGDKILDKPLIDFGGKGAFVAEFEEALLDGTIDLAVHSAKDMPMKLDDGLVIAGVLPRGDVRDVLVTKKGSMPDGISVGTGSLRRQIQLKSIYPKAQCSSVRGNVTTRMNKVLEGQFDGVILAAAGLERLGLANEMEFDYRYFSCKEMIPAGGQGIIAIEGRKKDKICELIREISDQNTWMELETERKILELLDAGCNEAIGVISKIYANEIEIQIFRDVEGKIYRQRGSSETGKRIELAEELVRKISGGRDE